MVHSLVAAELPGAVKLPDVGGASAPGSVLLPRVRRLGLSLTCREETRLPALPSLALHGALGSLESTCAALRPAAPTPAARRWLGLTDGVPLPYAFSPVVPVSTPSAQVVPAGEVVRLFLSTVSASEPVEEVLAALRSAGSRGWGSPVDGESRLGESGEHVPFDVELGPLETYDWGQSEAAPQRAKGSLLRLDFTSPARIKEAGAFVSRVESETLWSTIVRRAALLSALYGDPPTAGSEAWFLLAAAQRGDWGAMVGAEGMTSCPLRVVSSDLHRVELRRYSGRQKRRMTWPGMQGHLVVELLDPRCLPLFELASLMGIGKNTTFGFGAFQLSEPEVPGVWGGGGLRPRTKEHS